jgi:HemX protein
MPNLMGYLSLAFYAASFLCYARLLYAPNVWLGRLAALLLGGGLVLHYFALLGRTAGTHAAPYEDLYGSMSLFAWLLGVTYLGLELLHRQRSVGSLVSLLMVLWMVCLDWLAPREMPVSPAHGPLFEFHVTLNIWAYAAFALSFVLSSVYLMQDRMLHSRRPGAPFWRFPALEVLDRMSRSSVCIGLAALAFGVGSGLIWEHRLTGAYAWSDPKVVVTLLIVGVYIAYLWLSRTSGWRGARAALVCALSFAIVLFSYTVVNLYLTTIHRFF